MADEQPQVQRVYYPGLASHPDHELAKKQMRDFGGMICVSIQGGGGGGAAVHDADQAVQPGGESGRRRVAGVPSGDDDPRQHSGRRSPARGIDDGLVRLSVGIEDVADLQEDLRRRWREGLCCGCSGRFIVSRVVFRAKR